MPLRKWKAPQFESLEKEDLYGSATILTPSLLPPHHRHCFPTITSFFPFDLVSQSPIALEAFAQFA